MPSIASSLRARTHHRGHGGTQRSQPSLRSGADEGVRPYTNGGVIAYLRMLGERWIESWLRFGWGRGKGLAAHRGTDEIVGPYTDMGGKTDGYYLADGTDCGGGRDMELGEYGEGGAGGDHS